MCLEVSQENPQKLHQKKRKEKKFPKRSQHEHKLAILKQ